MQTLFTFCKLLLRCELKICVFHLTCENNEYHITCPTQNTYDLGIKNLYVDHAKDDCKIFDLTSIFAEDDTRKWTFKTHAQLQAEKKRLTFTFMTASHPRVPHQTALAKLDRDLLEAIARLSLS